MIKKILIIICVIFFTFSCGKKGNPLRDGEPVINPKFKNSSG